MQTLYLSRIICTFLVLLFHSSSLAAPTNPDKQLVISSATTALSTQILDFSSANIDPSSLKVFVNSEDVTKRVDIVQSASSVRIDYKLLTNLPAKANSEFSIQAKTRDGVNLESTTSADVVAGFEFVATQIRFAPIELLESSKPTPYEYQDGLGSIWVFAQEQSSQDAQITLKVRAVDEQGELMMIDSLNPVQFNNLPVPLFKNAVSGSAFMQGGVAEIPVVLGDFRDEEIDLADFLEKSGVSVSFLDSGSSGANVRALSSSALCALVRQNKNRIKLLREAGVRLGNAIRAIPQAQALQPSLDIWIAACQKLPPPLIGTCLSDVLIFARLWLESNDPARMQNSFETQAGIALRFIETGDLSNDFDVRLSWLTEEVYYQSINKPTMVDFLADAVGTALLAGGTVVSVKVGQAAIAAITRRFPNLAPALLTRLGLPRVTSPGAATPNAAQPPSRPNTSAPIDIVPGKIDYSGLQFPADDFVYGPSAGGKLREFSITTGTQRLSALDKPLELDWKQFSQQIMERTLARGNTIRFDLTNMQNIEGVLAGTFQASATTSFELRFLRDNWSRFAGNVKFYRVVDGKMIEVNPPWLP